MIRKIGLGIIAIIVGALIWLVVAPPDLIRVGANYTAKMICSNVVLAGRDPDEVLEIDVQAPGHPILKLMRYSIDERGGETVVRTGLFGFIGKGLAFGNASRGCTTVPDPRQLGLADVPTPFKPPQIKRLDGVWPRGSTVDPVTNVELDAALNDPRLAGEGMRAIVVVKDGKIIAERYGEGFSKDTPLLGWSMAKTVTASIVGAAQKAGYLNLDDPVLFNGWEADDRKAIRLADLMGMVSDLKWNEGYGSVSDVTRMLYLEPDMAGFAADKPIDADTPEPTGDSFQYSSGTTVMISRYWQDKIGDEIAAAQFPSKALFEPLGMVSARLETDAIGTFAGSSYLYATARDWARFGQLLLQRGAWNGQSLLPTGYVDWMTDPHPASGGQYGRGQTWLLPPREHEEQTSTLPDGTIWAAGHDGQSIAVIPAHNMVIVRLGLTPSKLNYKPGALTEAVIRATQ